MNISGIVDSLLDEMDKSSLSVEEMEAVHDQED